MHSRIMIWLLAAAVGVWGAPRVKAAMEFLDFKQREYAHADIVSLTRAARSYRSLSGSYEDISVRVLSGRGYGLTGYTDGLGENVYGGDIAVMGIGTDHGRALATYEFDDGEDCGLYLGFYGQSMGHRDGFCDGETFRFILE